MAVGGNFAAEAQPKGLAIELLSDIGQAGLLGSRRHGNKFAVSGCGAVNLRRWVGMGFEPALPRRLSALASIVSR